ncbi:hypothetical protein BD410DRAFT_652869 [Rickenella mellea]|uniref:Uncharacterized protein n=1 Tax=Rickenella mellea TaxID=50990 RepID=A0A4Y7PNF3_9AGAM|nr:hypothetical protein BD410DRAFT_652869 [Rickenella mellea]
MNSNRWQIVGLARGRNILPDGTHGTPYEPHQGHLRPPMFDAPFEDVKARYIVYAAQRSLVAVCTRRHHLLGGYQIACSSYDGDDGKIAITYSPDEDTIADRRSKTRHCHMSGIILGLGVLRATPSPPNSVNANQICGMGTNNDQHLLYIRRARSSPSAPPTDTCPCPCQLKAPSRIPTWRKMAFPASRRRRAKL